MRFRSAITVLALFIFSLILHSQSFNSVPTASSEDVSTTGHKSPNALEVLSDTQGVNFGPYLTKMLHAVRLNWYGLIPSQAKAPQNKRGNVDIEFRIKKDGSIEKLAITKSSGDEELDHAALSAIQTVAPLKKLPRKFKGEYLGLRMHFFYNPPTDQEQRTGNQL